jgi:hypothetical protein
MVDFQKRFIDIEVGWPGSVTDARVFQYSALGQRYEELLSEFGTNLFRTRDDIEENIPAFLLGDSAYTNTWHMVTTYKVTECNADRSVRHLNFRLSRAQYRVENVFGLLKSLFQIFNKPLKTAAEDLPFAVHLISSIFVLHNFLIDMQDEVQIKDGLIERAIVEARANNGIKDTNGPENENSTRNTLLRYERWLDVANERN